jgi:hypothetical protein
MVNPTWRAAALRFIRLHGAMPGDVGQGTHDDQRLIYGGGFWRGRQNELQCSDALFRAGGQSRVIHSVILISVAGKIIFMPVMKPKNPPNANNSCDFFETKNFRTMSWLNT